MNRFRRALVARTATALVLCGLLAGCYGSFGLTRAVYDLNGDIGRGATDNEMGQGVLNSIVMVVGAAIGAYGLSMFVDVLVLNTIEYWSGEPVLETADVPAHTRHAAAQP